MEEKILLFGTINPQKTNLLKLIEGDTSDAGFGLLDSTINEINDKLTVSSFEDFQEKFSQALYMPFCSSLVKLIDAKKQKKYVMTDTAEIFVKMLNINREQTKDFVRERNKLIKLVKRNGLNSDVTIDLRRQLQKISSIEYDTCSLTACLLEDICNGLGSMQESSINRSLAADIPYASVQIVRRNLHPEKPIYHLSENEQVRYLGILDVYVQEQKDDGKDRGLIAAWLAIPAYLSGRNYERLMRLYDNYCSLYRDMHCKYWIYARPFVETLLGIKMFFDNAAEKHETRQLLIANISLYEMTHVNNQKKLDIYLQTTNTKLYDRDIIRKVIIPDVAILTTKVKKVRKRFNISAGNEETVCHEKGSIGQAKTIIDALEKNIFGKYRVRVRYSDADTPKLPVLVGEDAVYTPCPMLDYDEMSRRIRVVPGKKIQFDDLGIEKVYIEDMYTDGGVRI